MQPLNANARASAPVRTELLGMPRAALEEFCVSLGARPVHGQRILRALYHEGQCETAAITGLGRTLRCRLAESAGIDIPAFSTRQCARDGVRKWLLQLEDGAAVETVFIPAAGRGTLCLSSQAGCALRCSFCATGAGGFQRNLSTAEIIAQVWRAHEALEDFRAGSGRRITNIVLMGMGEPLLNFDNVASAIDVLFDDLGFGIPGRRITVSTAGVAPAIEELARLPAAPALAVSLHAPTDELRRQLVPLNGKYPIARVLEACRRYLEILDRPRRLVTFEYTLIAGVNDSPVLARDLARLLAGLPCKINLIPFNPFAGSAYQRPTPETVRVFQQLLQRAGHRSFVRATRGEDVAAACGQLQGRVQPRTRIPAPLSVQSAPLALAC